MKKHFKLIDLDCANCAAKMEAAIKKLDGVHDATVSFMTQYHRPLTTPGTAYGGRPGFFQRSDVLCPRSRSECSSASSPAQCSLRSHFSCPRRDGCGCSPF